MNNLLTVLVEGKGKNALTNSFSMLMSKRTFKVGESASFISRVQGLPRFTVTAKIGEIVKGALNGKPMSWAKLWISRGSKYYRLTKQKTVRVALHNLF